MHYRLNATYVLRGWDKTPWVLVRRPENRVRYLRREEFQVLLLCDGRIDLSGEYISDEMRELLYRYEKENVVEPCPDGQDKEVLEEDQYYRYYENRFVRSVFWSVTGRCNYRCRHCYMDAPEGKLGELSHEQAVRLIDEMVDCGVLCVDITGGEPFVREDFWSLIDRILSYKITIGQVYTNGWLLTDEALDEFEKRKLKPEFSISFDGAGWHDWMRGIEGAEEAAVRAFKLCKNRDFPVSVEMCTHKGNLDTLPETVKLLSNLGVSRLRVSSIAQTELWRQHNGGYGMDFREYMEAMIRCIPWFFEAGMPMDITLAGVIRLRKNSTAFSVIPLKYDGTEKCMGRLLCGAARYACYITPEGRLLPCMPMTACKEQEMFPLVQDIGLKKGLKDSFYMDIVDSRVRDLLAVNKECASCEYKYLCGGGCRAVALEQTGDLMGCNGNQCILWKEGYVDRIQETAKAAVARYCGT